MKRAHGILERGSRGEEDAVVKQVHGAGELIWRTQRAIVLSSVSKLLTYLRQ